MTDLLISPLGLGLLLLSIRLLAHKRSKPWGCRITSTGLTLCLVLMTPFGANMLIKWIEFPTTPSQNCARASDRPIVLLAGGLDSAPRHDRDFGALTRTSLQRMMDLQQSRILDTHPEILISGGNPQAGISESHLMRNLAADLGVKANRITIEESSASTKDNAIEVAHILHARGQNKLVLVTSAWHMHRALSTFSKQGLDVCPLPVDSLYNPPGELGYFLPQSSALVKAETALHELAGMLVYWIQGIT